MDSDRSTFNKSHLTFDRKKRRVSCQLSVVSCQNGFTLAELIIGFAIVGIISVLIASIYFAHSRLFSNQSTLIDVASQNRLGLDEMTNQIRESQSIVNTCAFCSGDTTSSTILILQLWPIDSSSEPFEPTGSNYDFIIYKKDPTDNSKLIKKIIPTAGSFRSASERIIATDINDLQFSYDNDPTQASEVTVSLTTSATSSGKILTSTQTAKAVLRNK